MDVRVRRSIEREECDMKDSEIYVNKGKHGGALDERGLELICRPSGQGVKCSAFACETYTGKLQGAGASSEYKGTLLWLVKAPPTVLPSPPGLLQQSYATDAKAPADEIPTLIGEVTLDIVLQSMADKDEENTDAPDKSKPGDFVVLGVGTLRSASG
jgi:hypothetical protein